MIYINNIGINTDIKYSNPYNNVDTEKNNFNKIDREEKDRNLKNTAAKECETCKNRKYQDGSDDAGVSFKTPAHISPESSAAVVRSHEYEHVKNEQANAKQDKSEILSQSVQIYTAVCPECGRSYTSGGQTTTTVRKVHNVEKTTGRFLDKTI